MWKKIKYRLFQTSTLFAIILLFIIGISFLITVLEGNNESGFANVGDGLWWVFVTMSTTGYGDKVPISEGGRILAVITITGGIVIMSLLSGLLASVFVRIDEATRRGLMRAEHLRNHIIICGWKRAEMLEYILNIVHMNYEDTGVNAKNIVLVSNVTPDRVSKIKSHPKLKNINFIYGEYHEELVIKSANIAEAKKAIMLADTWNNLSNMEIDSKTVMAVLTIRTLSKSTHIIAELYDKKYAQYLRQASCDEVFFVGEFNKLMLASMTGISGFGNIFMHLMNRENGVGITTEILPTKFVTRPYGTVKSELQYNGNRILIGILEHVGNPITIKLQALREAQKTANISSLVENLQTAKGITANNPVLLPDDEYRITPNSMAIYLIKNTPGYDN